MSLNTGAGASGTQDSSFSLNNSDGSSGVTPAAGAGTGGRAGASPHSVSSIQKSELEAIMNGVVYANIPILPSPQFAAMEVASLQLKISNTEKNIIDVICKAMMKSAEEMQKRNRDDYVRRETADADKPGPQSGAQYLTYLMSISPSLRRKEIDGSTDSTFSLLLDETIQNWMINPIVMIPEADGRYPSASFVTGCLVGGIGAIESAIGADSKTLGEQLSIGPVADALAAAGPFSGLPGDYQSAAALVAALLYNGALNKASSETVATVGGEQPQDLAFALNFAKQVMNIITKNIEGNGTLDPQKSSQNGLVRLMLASIALNMLYRAGYGGMSGIDLASLLEGNTGDIPDAIKEPIEQLIDIANQYLPENPTDRGNILANLTKYVDSKQSVDSMLQTTRLLRGLMQEIEPLEKQV